MNCNVITLGIGGDIDAEMEMKTRHPQFRFIGVDPDEEVSGKMYRESLGGVFIKGTVGSEGNKFNSSIISMFLLLSI